MRSLRGEESVAAEGGDAGTSGARAFAQVVREKLERVPPDFANVVSGKPICVLCGKVLRRAHASAFWRFNMDVIQAYGWLGNCMFCSERCAAHWAVVKASTGSDE